MPLDIATTAFPNGISSMGALTFGVPGMLPFGGKYFWVDEVNGNDGNPGTANNPLGSIAAAYAQCRTGYNDVVMFNGTQHLTSSLAWSKDKTHLIGLCAPEKRGKRARLSVSGSVGFDKLLNVTAQGCLFGNFGTFYGWANASTALLAVSDTAGRNCYDNIEFLGFGDDTVSTGSANLTGSRAFKFNSSNGETTLRNCVFGGDTTVRNVANYTVEIAGAAPRMYFENCDFEADLGSSGTASSHLLIGASGIDRYLKMVGCRFGNFGGNAMAQALNVSASAGGTVWLDQCTAGPGITAWQGAPNAAVAMNMVAATAGGGLTHVPF